MKRIIKEIINNSSSVEEIKMKLAEIGCVVTMKHDKVRDVPYYHIETPK